MTLSGAKKKLNTKWEEVDYKYEINESLKKIKELLLELKDGL